MNMNAVFVGLGKQERGGPNGMFCREVKKKHDGRTVRNVYMDSEVQSDSEKGKVKPLCLFFVMKVKQMIF